MHRLSAGIERVLARASEDPTFFEALVSAEGPARPDLVREASIDLTPAELAVLAVVPSAELRKMVEGVVETRTRRRSILRLALGAAAVVGTGGVCGAFLFGPHRVKFTRGSRIDYPQGRVLGWLPTDDLSGLRTPEEILGALRPQFEVWEQVEWAVGPVCAAEGFSSDCFDYRVVVSRPGVVVDVTEKARPADADDAIAMILPDRLERCRFRNSPVESEFTVRFLFESSESGQ